MNLVKRDLKARYKTAVLGFFWSFAKPLFIMLILWIVFSKIVPIQLRDPALPFTLHLLCGILPWMFVTSGLMESMMSVLVNSDLVKKAQLPLSVFPAASVLANLVHFLLALLVLFGFIFAFGVRLSPWILLLPLIILFQTFFLFSVALILSSLYVFYRDVSSIMEVIFTGWFYATPIIYPMYMAQEKLGELGMNWAFILLMLNPMAPIVLMYRWVLLAPAYSQPELPPEIFLRYVFIAFLISIGLYLVGSTTFRYYSRRFADEL